MVKSDDDASSQSDSSSDGKNKRMPDDDYPAYKFDSSECQATASEKSLDASHISDTPSERFHQLSDVCSEMESDIIDRIHSCQSNENSESGSTCHFDQFNGLLLRGQDPACSSPHRDLMKNMEFADCMKPRTRSIDSSKSDADLEHKTMDEYRKCARRSSGSLSPRLAIIRRRESIEGFTQEEHSHEQEINNFQKIDDDISGTHISNTNSSPNMVNTSPSGNIPFKRADFGCSPGSPKRSAKKQLTRPGIGTIDICPSPTRHHRRAESPLCSSRVKRRYASDCNDEPKNKRLSLDGLNMELRSHKSPNTRHPLASGSSAFTCQVAKDRLISGSSVCSGESCGGSLSEISTPSPPYEAQFLHKDHNHGISNLVRDFDHQSDYSNATTPLHTPVNSRRGSHESILSTDSRDHNTLLHAILEKHKTDQDQTNMDCDSL